jgi:hypothetical protein
LIETVELNTVTGDNANACKKFSLRGTAALFATRCFYAGDDRPSDCCDPEATFRLTGIN